MSHLWNSRICVEFPRHRTWEAAAEQRRFLERYKGGFLKAQQCPHCNGFHLVSVLRLHRSGYSDPLRLLLNLPPHFTPTPADPSRSNGSFRTKIIELVIRLTVCITLTHNRNLGTGARMTQAVAEASQPQGEQEIKTEDVMKRYFELRDEEATTLARHKAELEPIKEEMLLIQRYMTDVMNQQGVSQTGVKGVGTAFFQTKDTVSITDWDATIKFIDENAFFNLLNRAVNKTAVKEYVEANAGALPPGVKLDVWREVQFRKGK
jgi:hypothetical protein